eukprot:SAG31_NODE_2101_length_6445_cov_16.552159_2_plen_391_part_00
MTASTTESLPYEYKALEQVAAILQGGIHTREERSKQCERCGAAKPARGWPMPLRRWCDACCAHLRDDKSVSKTSSKTKRFHTLVTGKGNRTTKNSATGVRKRAKRVNKQQLRQIYADLYYKIPRPMTVVGLKETFADKELRILMKHNGMLINDFDEHTGTYTEKTKQAKSEILVVSASQMVVPGQELEDSWGSAPAPRPARTRPTRSRLSQNHTKVKKNPAGKQLPNSQHDGSMQEHNQEVKMCEECGLKRPTIWVLADRKNVQRCAVCANSAIGAQEFQEHHGNDKGREIALKFSGCVAKTPPESKETPVPLHVVYSSQSAVSTSTLPCAPSGNNQLRISPQQQQHYQIDRQNLDADEWSGTAVLAEMARAAAAPRKPSGASVRELRLG